ncbi:hypothetical protein E1091_11210 [Micromonospora fluostatini]|uniref:Uncharacterized protein n=1 Tax=Micromonospora fluostatini TaxID=1629071 RepID=A0ABY2DGV8_9ACTN|nr:hypothetical protein E1091_11210 [Micromonospora fluostatini]
MTQPKTNRIPAPIYAAAGVGDLALEHLRKLPAVVTDLGGRVAADLGGKAVVTGFELRQRATETFRTANETAAGLREKGVTAADLNRLREAADTRLREVVDLNRLREVADVNRLREVADPDRLREAADLDRLREAATRNTAVVVAGAQAAQERALAVYGALVARGERVVGAGVVDVAETVNADIEATEATVTTAPTPLAATPAGTSTQARAEARTSTDVPTPADVAEVVEAKSAPAKTARGRAAAKPAAAKPSASRSTASKSTVEAAGTTAKSAGAKSAGAKVNAKAAGTKATRAKAAGTPAAGSEAGTPSATLPKGTKRTRPAAE